MGILSSDLAWIVVSDLKKARKFFTEILGMKEQHGCDEECDWVELVGKEGGAIIGLSQSNDYTPIAAGSNAVITFTVDNIEKTKQHFLKNNVQCIGDIMEVPGHVKLLLFKDHDGNYFQLAEKID